jgi:hypothetical protein
MAYIKITNEEKYIGMSADGKPDGVETGSTFHVLDTGEEYIFFNGTWERDLRLITALQSL